ncbi:MAG TPA: PAS domain-containing protein, partial [Longimicrobium sp.]|nr:PAS domain-containing protein [Longimicrobium sp.]
MLRLPDPAAPERPASRLRWPAYAAGAAAAAYLLARSVGLGPAPGPWAYWPIHGILLGILFRRPGREWAAIGAAAVGAQVLTIYVVRGDLAGGATPAGALLGFVQAALSVAILRRGARRVPPDSPGALAWFVLVAVILVPLAITPLTGLVFSLGLGLPFPSVWGPLFAGNTLSVLIFSPPFLWPAEEPVPRARLAEALLCQAGILALALLTFAGPDHLVRFVVLPYSMFPLLAWSMLRCGARWTSLAVVILATVGAWCTARGTGPFGGLDIPVNHRVLALQGYLAFVAFTALVLASLTHERLRTRAEMSVREAMRHGFFESSGRALILTDREGRIVFLNSLVEEAFGRPRAELVGRPAADFLHPDDAAAVARHDRRVLEQGEPLTFEETLPSPEGRRSFEVLRFPVRDHTGVIRYIGVSVRDDAVERELNSRLQGVQRVEILGRLAAGVAHDLNNMLTVVLGNTRMLRDDPDRPPEEREILHETVEAGTEAVRLTRRLMALGRDRANAPPVAEADAVIGELERLLRVLVRSNVDLDLRLGAPGTRVAADPTAIGQVVLNLVANARDAIPHDGRITID